VSVGSSASSSRDSRRRRGRLLSINWHNADPAPSILVLPPAAASLDEAHAAIELWEHYKRRTLDSAQRLAVEVMMAQDAVGNWAAPTTGREMPRQNGKGDEIEVVELWGLVQRAEAILHTIHDAVLLATQTQGRMLDVLSRPDLKPRIKTVWKGTGQQMIELRNGGVIFYRTRTGGGGRGVDDVDRLVVDEAQHATDGQIESLSPTLLANSNPQMNTMGTGGLAGKSEWWWGIRRRALSASPGNFGYVGHTAERVTMDDRGVVAQLPVDVEDRSVWLAVNPAVAAGRGQGMTSLEEQFLRLSPEGFAREHLCVWDPPTENIEKHAPKLDPANWSATAIENDVAAARWPKATSLAFDVTRDGEWSSISVGAGTITDPFVQTVVHNKGVGWLPAALVEWVAKINPPAVGYNSAGPVAAQIAAVLESFIAAGLSADLLRPFNGGEYKAACGGFYTDVVEGRLHHPADGQAPLDAAALDATERPLVDAFAWAQRSEPISPLTSATLARALLPVEVVETKPTFAF
jgi:hypothetical protein